MPPVIELNVKAKREPPKSLFSGQPEAIGIFRGVMLEHGKKYVTLRGDYVLKAKQLNQTLNWVLPAGALGFYCQEEVPHFFGAYYQPNGRYAGHHNDETWPEHLVQEWWEGWEIERAWFGGAKLDFKTKGTAPWSKFPYDGTSPSVKHLVFNVRESFDFRIREE